ncbi:MAG: GAF domain-containing protein [Anaerolineales bacterium]|nr:GAF domain-containing protein [Anaerolineales bacterium]
MEKELASAMIWSLFDSLHEGILIAEPDGTIIYVNEAAGALLNLAPDISSLQLLDHLIAPPHSWQDCLVPPFDDTLTTENGRLLTLHCHPLELNQNALIQIVISPQPHVSDLTNSAEALQQLTALTHVSSETDIKEQLTLLVNGLQKTGWNRVVLSLRDEAFRPTAMITAGISEEEQAFLQNNPVPPQAWLALFEDEALQKYRQGSCYFVPGNSAWAKQHLGDMVLPDYTAVQRNGNTWHPKDLLCVPLYNQQQQRIGLIGLDQPANGYRPTSMARQTIELYAQFAAAIIENAQLFQQVINRNREFELLLNNSNALSSTLDKKTILTTLAKQAIEAIGATGCTIYQWLPAQDKLLIIADMARDTGTAVSSTGTQFPLPNSPNLKNLLHSQQVYTIHLDDSAEMALPKPVWATAEDNLCTLIPLVLTGETYGFMRLMSENGRLQNIHQHENKLLSALANQAATALEIALIFEDTYERERFYGAMGNVSLALNSSLDRETVLNLICSEGQRIFSVDGAYIWQPDGDRFVGNAAAGHGAANFVGSTISATDQASFVTQIAQSGEPTFLNQITQEAQVEVRLPNPEAIQAALGVPLLRENDLTGILVLVDTQNPNRFNDKDVSWATTFGVQVAIALQNAKLFDELREFNETLDHRVEERTQALNDESNRVKILLRITTDLSASLDQDRVLSQALHLVNGVVNATEGAILLIDQESGEFIFRASIGSDRHIPPGGIPSGMMRNEGLAGWVVENHSAVIVHDTHEDPRWLERETSLKHRSVLGVPLILNEEVIGALMMFHEEASAFTLQQQDLVEAAASQVAHAINNASLYKLIFDQAEQLGSMLRTEIIQKANLEAILESIADGVIVADSQNEVDIANLPACNILDIPRSQLLGKSINELLGLYGHFGESWIHTINDWANNADRIEQWTYLADQLVIEDKFVSVHLSPVLSDNQFYGTVSIFRDITKEVEVDKLKSEFVSTVSHELRTPMTSIKGYADLMLMGAAGPMTDPQIRYLQVIKNNADRLHMLVNDLLDISRIETGKTGLDLRPLDIPQIISQVVEGHLNGRIQHEVRTVKVATDIAPSLPLVNADHARITQVLTNLLDNALNYTPDNGQITVAAKATHSYVHISVKDTGIGIAKENQGKIFDRFYRAEDSEVQRIPGTGLGLAIVRSLIEMHGGRLKVESELGKGSTFTFNLPVVIEDSDPT